MKIIQIKRYGSRNPCVAEVIDAPVAFDDESPPYEWIKIRTKTMPQIMLDYDCWFDQYGNLCSEHGTLSPSHFADLGREFHVKKTCGWDTDSGWLRVE